MKWSAVVMVAVGLVGAWAVHRATGDDRELMKNRLWVERMPRHERDLVLHAVALDMDDTRFGAAVVASRWRSVLEGFEWESDDITLKLSFPQDRKKLAVGYRAWKCSGKAPEPFELCLELSKAGRKLVLYSMHDWEIDPNTREIHGLPFAPPPLPTPRAAEADGAPWSEGGPALLLERLE
ncbi:MAG: hypothetical protein HY904_13765 [Deltaproteobacteria bacterium]|nr:hypothetical protein [Deltaproteobacteria bacterium]